MVSLKDYKKALDVDVSDFSEAVVCVAPFAPVHKGYLPFIEKIQEIYQETNKYKLVVVSKANREKYKLPIATEEIVDSVVLNIPHVNMILFAHNFMEVGIKLLENKIYPKKAIIYNDIKKSFLVTLESIYGEYYSSNLELDLIYTNVSYDNLILKEGITDEYITEAVIRNDYGQFKASLLNETDDQAIELFKNIRKRITEQ